MGTGATDFERWANATMAYRVTYEEVGYICCVGFTMQPSVFPEACMKSVLKLTTLSSSYLHAPLC